MFLFCVSGVCSVVFDCFWLSVLVQLIAWKDLSPNDLLCVEWDVKPYTLTQSLTAEKLQNSADQLLKFRRSCRPTDVRPIVPAQFS